MTISDFPETTVVFAKDQPPYLPLPAHKVKDDPNGRVITCWTLSFRERFKVLFTGRVWHQCLTFNTPIKPVKITLEKPEMS